eukprot:TRINITY_DN10250_c0_g1_i1.p1 TRINITY_DN10250_c0_g1~~TRINITY_DN10250_c0_g1_i1.p1  ORF type:complete len:251 (+),score=56.11 TRINITY_DN10250_c0_g1_i1:11-763(+)
MGHRSSRHHHEDGTQASTPPPTKQHAGPEFMSVILSGAAGVGKTCMVWGWHRPDMDVFVVNREEIDDPTIEDSYEKEGFIVDSNPVHMEVFDSANFYEDKYSDARENFHKKCDGYILAFSLTDRSSFTAVSELYDYVLRKHDALTFPVVLVGTKLDLISTTDTDNSYNGDNNYDDGNNNSKQQQQQDQSTSRAVSTKEIHEWISKRDVPYVEISSKSKIRGDMPFEEIARLIRKNKGKQQQQPRKARKGG